MGRASQAQIDHAMSVLRANRKREGVAREAEAALLTSRNREAERKKLVRWAPNRPERGRSTVTASFEQRRQYRQGLQSVREARFAREDWSFRGASGGADIAFEGFACVTCADFDDDSAAYQMSDAVGDYVESVLVGAFAKTLRQGCDVAFLLNHDGPTLARTRAGTLKLAERTSGNPTGLYCEARLDPKRPDVQILMSAIERGDLDEMSFGFRVVRQRWSDDYTRRWIQEINMNLGDVSVVNYGANGHTGGLLGINQPKKTPDGYMDPFGDDPTKSGAGGYTETEGSRLLLEARALTALNRARDLERRRRL